MEKGYVFDKMAKNPYDVVVPIEDFDWGAYGNGYVGGSKKCINFNIKSDDPRCLVYSHEPYAQELYDRMMHSVRKTFTDGWTPKDALKGSMFNVTDIRRVSKTEVEISTTCGYSGIVDMNKEKPFMEFVGCDTVDKFMNALVFVNGFKESILDGMTACVCDGGRISIWEGYRIKTERMLFDEISRNPEEKAVFQAKIKDKNEGGYFVDVCGVRCFMPGSLAAAGVINDFDALVGKTIPVMIVNYIQRSGFIASYKMYLSTILPQKIENELHIGMKKSVRVTGSSRNGLFVTFKDNDDEWVFSGLIHRSVMSKDFEQRFNEREFVAGDEMFMYIHAITVDDKGNKRIVLTDNEDMLNKEPRRREKKERKRQ